jgi:spermidine/putrescine-binding protein
MLSGPDEFTLAQPLTRRQLMLRGGSAALAIGGAGVLAGCGSSSSKSSSSASNAGATNPNKPISGTIHYFTYPGWIGNKEYARFEKLHPGVTIKEIAYNGSSTRGLAVQVRENPSAYDMLGAFGLAAAPTLLASPSLIAKPDWSRIPNIKYMPQRFRTEYPFGVPTDYGKIGFAYRKDLISERPTSWADVWQLAPKYSGKITFLDAMEDTMGNTLKMLGYSGNSTNPTQINRAKDKLIQIKPHLQGILDSDVVKPLVNGTSVITMDYDFDIALGQQQQKNIVWVTPTEGLMAYLEGQVAVAGTKQLDAVTDWLNFTLAPINYANFVNTTGTAYLEPAATPLIKKSISQNPILAFTPAILAKVEFEKDKGSATGLWTTAWSEFKAA